MWNLFRKQFKGKKKKKNFKKKKKKKKKEYLVKVNKVNKQQIWITKLRLPIPC